MTHKIFRSHGSQREVSPCIRSFSDPKHLGHIVWDSKDVHLVKVEVQIFPLPFLMKLKIEIGWFADFFSSVNHHLKKTSSSYHWKKKNGNNTQSPLKMMQREESESSRAEKLRKTQLQ